MDRPSDLEVNSQSSLDAKAGPELEDSRIHSGGAGSPNNGASQLERALMKVTAELREGLKHGFFEYRVRCEIAKGRRRELVLEAGKKYKFIIPEEEVSTNRNRIGDS